MKLRSKMLLLLVLPVWCGMVALTGIIAYAVSRDVRTLSFQMLDGIVQARAAEIGRWAQSHLRSVVFNARSVEFQSGDLSRIIPFLRRRHGYLASDQVDEFYDGPDGFYHNSLGRTGFIGDRAYFVNIMAGKAEAFVSDGLYSRDTGKPLVVFAAPVHDVSSRIIGVAGTAVSLDTLSGVAGSVRIGEGYGVIIDGTLTVIAHPNPDFILKLNISKPEDAGYPGLEGAVDRMRAKQSGFQRYRDRAGTEKLLFFAPVPHTDWSMAVALPLAQANASAVGITRILVISSLSILAALIFLILIAVQRIVRPIGALSSAMQSITEGSVPLSDLSLHVNPDSQDEIGLLARYFNSMAERLGTTLSQYDTVNKALAERNAELERTKSELESLNEDLEDRIRLRTSSLAEANERLEKTNIDLERALSELRKAQSQVELTAKLAVLGRLSAGIAHDLNTPLGAILSSSVHSLQTVESLSRDILPVYAALAETDRGLVASLLDRALIKARSLVAFSDRKKVRALTLRFQAAGIERADLAAERVADLGAFDLEDAVAQSLGAGGWPALDLAHRLASVAQAESIILESARKASATVEALVAYSRGDEFERSDLVCPADEIDTILALYETQMKHAIELERDYRSREYTVGYRDKLNQVWVNLLNNALQAMEYRGTLSIAIARGDRALVVSFTDSGPGIAQDLQPMIFTPFFTTKRPGEGTGLGLDTCKRIVERHGGTIGFSSRPGRTTFWVRLPAAESPVRF